MTIIKKDAAIQNVGPDDAFPGEFEVVLSAPTLDRDGDTLLPEEWKTPLPDHITFDQDHGMSVASTVGSGTPSIDATGKMIVRGTYSSLPRAQEVRTLVNEGHIRTTSVAFMTEKSQQKDGKAVVQRELLNGAFVAIPSNREAVVLNSKGLGAKVGARNNSTDAEHIQAIHDHAVALGAKPAAPADDDTKAVFARVVGRKDADTESDTNPMDLIAATDAAIDEAIDLFATVDLTDLPPAIAQAVALVQAADAAVDELMDVVGIPDPDEDADTSGADSAPASGAAPAAPDAGAKKAPVEGAASITEDDVRAKALEFAVAQFI